MRCLEHGYVKGMKEDYNASKNVLFWIPDGKVMLGQSFVG